MIPAAEQLGPRVGIVQACRGLGISRATLYRRRRALGAAKEPAIRSSQRALSSQEREHVLEVLTSERFMDDAPREVYAALLDEGIYLCSVRTMYRLLAANGQVKERRNQLRHPQHPKPELVARAPNQVWSWDLTKLLGPEKWSYYCLYVILDLFSRYVVGWMVAERESAALARRLIRESSEKQEIEPGELILHADRGPSMTSQPVAQLLAALGVTKTHSRPHVSNDNPYSEAQFKTLKYRPEFPHRFASLEEARSFCRAFFAWYNTQHHHTGLGMLTPEMVHHDRSQEVIDARNTVLAAAYAARPERFVNKPPKAASPAPAVWINQPESRTVTVRA